MQNDGNLKPAESEEGSLDFFQKDEEDLGLSEHVDNFVRIKQEISDAEKAVKEMRAEKDKLEKALLSSMKANCLEGLKSSLGKTISIAHKRSYSKEGDGGDVVDWCMENDWKKSLSVHSGTWNSMCKSMDPDHPDNAKLEGLPGIPPMAKVYEYETLSVGKS